jgi:hypothetical protein
MSGKVIPKKANFERTRASEGFEWVCATMYAAQAQFVPDSEEGKTVGCAAKGT